MRHAWSPIIPKSSDAWDRITDAALSAADPRSQDQAILYAYLGLATGDPVWTNRAVDHLNTAIATADALHSTRHWELYGGLAGLGWVVEHLSPLLGPAQEDLNADTDAVILRELQRGRWTGPYDLAKGLVGFGVYFLERLPKDTASEGLALVVAHLEAHFQREYFPERSRTEDLSPATGVPGVIHFLTEAASAGIEVERANRLRDRAIDWILAQDPASSELGIAAIFLQAASRTGRDDCRNFAHHLLDRWLASPPDAGEIAIAHTLNRMYQSEDDPRCGEMAIAWFERALTMPQPHDNPAFRSLALLAAVTPIEPNWDRRMLLSTRSI